MLTTAYRRRADRPEPQADTSHRHLDVGYIISGALLLIVGVVLFAAPGAGALALVLVIGAYAVLVGIILLALAFGLRSLARGRVQAAV